MPKWSQQILAETIDFCNDHGLRSFALQEFTFNEAPKLLDGSPNEFCFHESCIFPKY